MKCPFNTGTNKGKTSNTNIMSAGSKYNRKKAKQERGEGCNF